MSMLHYFADKSNYLALQSGDQAERHFSLHVISVLFAWFNRDFLRKRRA